LKLLQVRVCREKTTDHVYAMKKLKKSEMLRRGQVYSHLSFYMMLFKRVTVFTHKFNKVIMIHTHSLSCDFFLGWTCQSGKESPRRGWQQLHCQTLLLFPGWRVSLSYYGVSTGWRYDDSTYEKGYLDWRWSQILCRRNCSGYWIYTQAQLYT